MAADLFAGFDAMAVAGISAADRPRPQPAMKTPKEWADGLDLLDRLPVLDWMTKYQWGRLVADAQSFGRLWAPQAHALGWTAQELFGCPHNVARSIYLPSGVVYLLEGRNVLEIHDDRAVIENRSGPPNVYRRGVGDRTSCVAIWEAFGAQKP